MLVVNRGSNDDLMFVDASEEGGNINKGHGG